MDKRKNLYKGMPSARTKMVSPRQGSDMMESNEEDLDFKGSLLINKKAIQFNEKI